MVNSKIMLYFIINKLFFENLPKNYNKTKIILLKSCHISEMMKISLCLILLMESKVKLQLLYWKEIKKALSILL